jgi:hypothetical protein
MSSVRPGININDFTSSSSSSSSTSSDEQTQKFFYLVAYYAALFLNWICEIYTHVTENPIIILWVFVGLISGWAFKRIFKWIRERSLVNDSLKNMNN